MYTLEKCEKLWEEAGRHGSLAERVERTKRWEPYYSYLAGKTAEGETPPFAAYMVKEAILTPDTSVLDIGAGMGNYSLAFADACRRVTALEPVEACLDTLRNRAAARGLENIRTVHGFWEHFSGEEMYDVSFASMCPAICNTAELRRMEALTRRTCCLVAVQRGSYDKHRRTMMQELEIKPEGGMTTEAIHYINALYLMGRKVNVKFAESRKSFRVPVERVLEQYPIYFEIFGVPAAKSRAYLENYLARHAAKGYLEDESYMRQALIFWNKE